VKNKDLWEALLGEIERKHDVGVQILFWRIPRELNTIADQWAKEAAAKGEVPEKFYDISGVLV
jgi:ribonuclease HI